MVSIETYSHIKEEKQKEKQTIKSNRKSNKNAIIGFRCFNRNQNKHFRNY
jgi:hypothetical protein